MRSMGRRQGALALLVFAVLAAALLREGFLPGRVLISSEAQRNWLPWSAVLPAAEPHNRFVVDQPQVFFPYLMEAQRVYRGEVGALWTSRGGGGLPFFGNISSSLLHPLTLLATVLPIGLLPLAQGLATLVLSALFTWLFLRRLGVSAPAAGMAAVGFGFGGHQVFWLQYALSHALLALPFTFWAAERFVERRSPRRLVVLAAGYVLLVLGGHPETTAVSILVVSAWLAFRLRDRQGWLALLGAGLLALGLAAVQWLPFLEYSLASRGLYLRSLAHAQQHAMVGLGEAALCLLLGLAALLLLRGLSGRGPGYCGLAAAATCAALLVARAAGLSAAGGALALPELYGNPLGGGLFTAAQDFPGLNAAYVGVLPVVLLVLGVATRLARGPALFFSAVAALLWGTAFHVPGIEGLVRAVPGLSQVQPTRFLGPAGFALACGGALVLDRLSAGRGAGREDAAPHALRLAGVLGLAALACWAATRLLGAGEEPAQGLPRLAVSAPELRHGAPDVASVTIPLDATVEQLRLRLGRQVLFEGPPALPAGASDTTLRIALRRIEEGRQRLVVELRRAGRWELLADQPFEVERRRQLSARDAAMLALSMGLAAWLVAARRPRPALAWLAAALVAADVLGLAEGYNTAAPAGQLYPRTATVDFLRAQPAPFRILTEGAILPPDTQIAAGVDHLMSYDNIGYQSNARLLAQVPIDADAFWQFRSSRASADYASPRFDLLDVRYVLTGRSTDLSDVPGFVLAHESETRVWENTRNLGRAFIASRAVNGAALPVSELAALDLRETAVLEQDLGRPLGGRGSAAVLEHRGSLLRVRTRTDGDALLVLAENWAPGWTASVSGGPEQPTLRADASWQAIPVPAGEHEVVLRYRPASVRVGRAVSLLALAVAAVMLCLGRPLRARAPRPAPAAPPPEPAGAGRPGAGWRLSLVLLAGGLLLHAPRLAGPFPDGLSGDCGAMFSVMARNSAALGWSGAGLMPAINIVPPGAGGRVDHYGHHPPGLPWLVSALSRLPLQPETAARLAALLLTLASVLLLADIAARLLGRGAGLAAGALALLLPAGLHHGLLVNYETAALPPLLFLTRSLLLQRGSPALAGGWAALADWIALAPLLLAVRAPWRRRLPALAVAGLLAAGLAVLGRALAPGSAAETLQQARLASFLNPAFDAGAWLRQVAGFCGALFGWALLPAAAALLVWPRRPGPLRAVLSVLLLAGLANVTLFAFHATSHETYVLLLLPWVVLSTTALLFPPGAGVRLAAVAGLALLLVAGVAQARAAAPARQRVTQAPLGDAFREVTAVDAVYLHPRGVPFLFMYRAGRHIAPPWGVGDADSARARVDELRRRLGLPELPGVVFTHAGETPPAWVEALGPGEPRGSFVFRPLP